MASRSMSPGPGRRSGNASSSGESTADGSVESASSPAANNVNLLVNTVILNYMSLHGQQGTFTSMFPNHGLGSSASIDRLTAFQPIVNGTIPG